MISSHLVVLGTTRKGGHQFASSICDDSVNWGRKKGSGAILFGTIVAVLRNPWAAARPLTMENGILFARLAPDFHGPGAAALSYGCAAHRLHVFQEAVALVRAPA